MTKREFLDIVFALAPNEANAIMDAFDEYVERGNGMFRLTTLISFCLGAIITRSMRRQDYFILTFALIAFVANIAVVYLIER